MQESNTRRRQSRNAREPPGGRRGGQKAGAPALSAGARAARLSAGDFWAALANTNKCGSARPHTKYTQKNTADKTCTKIRGMPSKPGPLTSAFSWKTGLPDSASAAQQRPPGKMNGQRRNSSPATARSLQTTRAAQQTVARTPPRSSAHSPVSCRHSAATFFKN